MNNTSNYVVEIKMPPSVLKSIFKPILLVTAIIYGIMTFYNSWMAIPFVLVLCALACMVFFVGTFSYRYTLNSQELRISKVNSKKMVGKEKVVSVSAMELLAKSKSDRLNFYISKDKKVKMRDYTSRGNPTQEYVLVSKEQNGVMMSMLELDDTMLDAFYSVIPKKVMIN